MKKLTDVLLFIMDIGMSLVVYPVLYIMNVTYLLYICIRCKAKFIPEYKLINKAYGHFILNGLKIHKERILGV